MIYFRMKKVYMEFKCLFWVKCNKVGPLLYQLSTPTFNYNIIHICIEFDVTFRLYIGRDPMKSISPYEVFIIELSWKYFSIDKLSDLEKIKRLPKAPQSANHKTLLTELKNLTIFKQSYWYLVFIFLTLSRSDEYIASK